MGRMMRSSVFLLLAALGLAGAAPAEAARVRPLAPDPADYPDGQVPRIVIVNDLPAAPDGAIFSNHGMTRHRWVYLHRWGGTYTGGSQDDPVKNVSRLLSGSYALQGPNLDDTAWRQVVECVEDVFAPFAVTVTDVEPPPDVHYVEAVVTRRPQDIGMEAGIGGVAAGPACAVTPHAINFTFAEVWSNSVAQICFTIAHETGHNLGLEHTWHCTDVMSYGNCGAKSFRDLEMECGGSVKEACTCTTPTANSYQRLKGFTGPADDVPPTVTLVEPADGARVGKSFEVLADPADQIRIDGTLQAGKIDRVELWIDGVRLGTREGTPWVLKAPVSLAVGDHEVEVRAYDGHENMASDSVTVTLVGECTSDADCPAGDTCSDERCLAGVGTFCSVHADCASGQCFVDPATNTKFCTQECSTSDSSSCPSGFTCEKPQVGTPKCMPGADSGGGWCAASAGRGSPAGGLAGILLLVLALALVVRRRPA
jgi:MYXO-CTERM domain-containing protein